MPVAAKTKRKAARKNGKIVGVGVDRRLRRRRSRRRPSGRRGPPTAGTAMSSVKRVDHAEGAGDHRDERPEGDPRAAVLVREPATEGAGDRADEGAEEGVVGEVDADARDGRDGLVPEVELDQQRHRGGVADERAERADVEERHHPGVLVLQRPRSCSRGAGLGAREVVHEEPRGDRGDHGEGGVEVARALEVEARLAGLDQPEDARAADDDRQEELDDRDAEVAAGRVEAERHPLLLRRVEEVDVGHRAGEVAAAEARRRGDQAEHPVRRLRVLHSPGEQQRRHQQRERAHDGPVAAAELRHRERVGQPDQRADQVGDGDQQEQLARR